MNFTPDDIQGWHLYTGTYDGTVLRLYIDGDLVADRAVKMAIPADSGESCASAMTTSV